MNAWERIWEVGKKIESFIKIIQGSNKAFKDLLKRLTSERNRMVTNSEAGQISGFQNANSLQKKEDN